MEDISRRPIRGVVFDLDNTLIRSRQGSLHALGTVAETMARHLQKFGINHSRTHLLRKLRHIERDRRAPESGLVPRALYDRDKWWKTLLKQLDLTGLEGPWIHETTLRYWEAYMKASPPYKDAELTLKRLKSEGMRLAIVSDSDGTPGVKGIRIRRLPFYNIFDTVVVAGENTPKVKPSKTPFLLVARRLNLPPRQCAYVGDNPSTDIEGAQQAGMITILVKRRQYMVLGGLRTSRPTYRVSSLKQVPSVLREAQDRRSSAARS